MRAFQAASLGGLEGYRLVEVDRPETGPGEVGIRIAACGVAYVDALIALGRYQVKPPLPHIPGMEAAGWIDAVGSGVSGLAVGDRVMARVSGGFVDYATVPASLVVRLPQRMPFEQAAGFWINYATALHALRDRAQLQSGETLLVIGAAGGVGLAAVQVGKLLGSRVIGVASTADKRALAMRIGADVALDREPAGWRDRLRAAAPQGIDVVFDPVAGPLLQPAFRSLRWRGRYLVVGFAFGEIPALPLNLPLLKGSGLIGVDYRQFADVFEKDKARHDLHELLDWVADGRLDPPVGRVFAFEQAGEALAFAQSGEGSGKTVLRIATA